MYLRIHVHHHQFPVFPQFQLIPDHRTLLNIVVFVLEEGVCLYVCLVARRSAKLIKTTICHELIEFFEVLNRPNIV